MELICPFDLANVGNLCFQMAKAWVDFSLLHLIQNQLF